MHHEQGAGERTDAFPLRLFGEVIEVGAEVRVREVAVGLVETGEVETQYAMLSAVNARAMREGDP